LSDIYHILLTTSHRAKATQDFLQNVVPDFISAEECPTYSPDIHESFRLFFLGHLPGTRVWGA